MASVFGRLLGKVWAFVSASCVPVSAFRDTQEHLSHACRTSVWREKEGKKGGEVAGLLQWFFFSFGVAVERQRQRRRQKSLNSDSPHTVVFVVCAPSLTTQRTSVSRLARSESEFLVRAGLERPAFDGDASIAFFFRSQNLSLSLFSSLTLPPLRLNTTNNSRPPPRPWAATTTAASRSPQRPSSA